MVNKCIPKAFSTIVFANSIGQVEDLFIHFSSIGIDVKCITGKASKKGKGQILIEFANRAFSVLLNCGVLMEGTDLLCCDCIPLIRTTCNQNMYI